MGAQQEESLSKNKLSEIGQVGGCLTLIWKMSLDSHFFFDLTPKSFKLIKVSEVCFPGVADGPCQIHQKIAYVK